MRKYMEDEISIESGSTDQIPTTYLGVFDGHGGKEAAIYARDNLFDNLKAQPGFFDDEPEKVKEAIRQAFIKTHMDMFKIVGKLFTVANLFYTQTLKLSFVI